jgi:CRP/FNR family transcriptional regulator, dissimilatory nitrate respiration regulator
MIGYTTVFDREDLALLRGAPLFSNVSPDSVEKLIAASQLRLCENREILFHPNQPANTVFVVLLGKIQVYRGEAAGKHAVLSIMLPGAAFALEAVLDNGHYAATAEAVGTSRLLAIPATAFRKALANGGGLAASTVRVLSQNLGQAFQQLERIQLKPTSQRLADFLLGLIPEHGSTAELVLPYEKALIANYLGMEPESLSRALKELQDLGVANRGRRIRIADVPRLRAFNTSQPTGTRAA